MAVPDRVGIWSGSAVSRAQSGAVTRAGRVIASHRLGLCQIVGLIRIGVNMWRKVGERLQPLAGLQLGWHLPPTTFRMRVIGNVRVCPPGMLQGRPQTCGTARGGCFLPVVAPRATRHPLPRRGSSARALSPLNLPRVVPRRAGPFCRVQYAAR